MSKYNKMKVFHEQCIEDLKALYEERIEDLKKVASCHDSKFAYNLGETVEVPNFDTNRWNECAPGIHFFITRQEAVDFGP